MRIAKCEVRIAQIQTTREIVSGFYNCELYNNKLILSIPKRIRLYICILLHKTELGNAEIKNREEENICEEISPDLCEAGLVFRTSHASVQKNQGFTQEKTSGRLLNAEFRNTLYYLNAHASTLFETDLRLIRKCVNKFIESKTFKYFLTAD
ncbi:hypothetical protein ANN_22402 [Periplaneta americana]|uniref:Uncharacterized protein n=1 Tax=Periplaneta americana TaxID=6978 RepID=A0ABQ8S911_PERAM|nr:hypothetical protein ANN_22402 [Periplaneta americana]